MEWGTPVQWGWFLLFSRSEGHKTKETYPTRPGSVEKHNLRYTEFYGDGDSKSFTRVKGVYEDDGIEMEKKECIGHVQKRVGTALRKLKRENPGVGGKGKLTDSQIDKLQNYYGIAIRSNVGNLAGMKKAIHASLMHCASTE